jgi:GNAT superfamily N-acetyltransferase
MPVRAARPADATRLAELSCELGYPAESDEIAARLPFLLEHPDHILVVATDDTDVPTGWLHALVRRQLESDAFVQIVGLVVGETQRSRGIGAELLRAAEAWARTVGVRQVRVRSNVTRSRAHGFYLRAGYTLRKTSHLFVKEIAGGGTEAVR